MYCSMAYQRTNRELATAIPERCSPSMCETREACRIFRGPRAVKNRETLD